MTRHRKATATQPLKATMMGHEHVRKFLDLSTGHLTPATRNRLDSTELLGWPVAGGRTAYGYFIYAHEEDDEEIPDDVWECCQKARELDCEYLLFDADAAEVEGLPTYDD